VRRGWRILTLSLFGAASSVSFSGCDFEADLFATLQCMAGDQESCNSLFEGSFPGPTTPVPTSPTAPGPSTATVVLGSKSKAARVRFTIKKATFGPVIPSGSTYSGNASTASGSFRGPRRASGLPLGGPLRGTWRARLGFKLDTQAHTGSTNGLLVLKFKGRGKLCLTFSTKYAVSANNTLTVKGKFNTAGGTGAASHVSARGRYVNKHVRGKTWSMKLTGRPHSGKAKAMPAACRAV
jgi:hypothetical protein